MYRLTQYKVSLVKDSSVMAEGSKRISSVDDVVRIAQDMTLLDREQLRAIYVNSRHDVIGWEVVSQGTLTASLAHPREIFKGAILASAAGVILIHNHPSGDPSPSEEDMRLTRRIVEAGRILGIELLDHCILAERGSYSFKTAGHIG